MAPRFMTPAQQVQELDAIIALCRQGAVGTRRRPFQPTEHQVAVLKAIAADIRGRMPGVPGTALRELQRRIADAAASRTAAGWDAGAMRGIAEQLIGYWPAVRQGLERMDAETANLHQEAAVDSSTVA
jgi:hypothetical protein